MNAFSDVFPANVTGSSSHATHVGHEGAVSPPPLADIVDGPSWDAVWIDLGGEG